MRREAMFSGDSPYEVMLRGNLLLHEEAAALIAYRLDRAFGDRDDAAPIAVLDLACGVPITMAAVMGALDHLEFRYTGVDVNPDQVARAARLELPANVSARIEEGDAWDLTDHVAPGPYDIVFVGLNWHHGTPEELWFVASQVRDLLAPGGRLINHDCYRPDDAPYLRRPRQSLENGKSASLEFVDAARLVAAGVPDFGFIEQPATDDRPAWRVDLIDRLERGYRDGGGTDEGARIVTAHSWARDYPISLREARTVLAEAGFEVHVDRFAADLAPLAPYTAVVIAAAPLT